MSPVVEGVALSAGVAAVVGTLGAVGVLTLGRRRPAVAAALAPLVVVASVAAGVAASSYAMFLSAADAATVLWLLLAAVPVAVGVGLVLARRAHRLTAEHAAALAARDRDRAVEERRREMVAWVSHDLRTPLAAVRVLTEAVDDGVTAPADAIGPIQSAGARMSAMVDDLLALSRLQSPTFEPAREPADVGDLVSDAIAAAQPLADAGAVRLAGEVDAPVVARVDAAEVSRALANLVVNAVRHTPAGETVCLRVSTEPGGSGGSRTGTTAVVQVTDACGGIPEADLPRLFDAGWRGTPARSPGAPGGAGAGIGLSIVREVAEAHGGGVAVQNVALPDGGRGCRFTLTLPA
ncbi:hypothetical protein GCM10009809_16970 [Isoptericola hypogeus]|uniref:histidine kinase n=1 Tax=Isoptericola hypogeus TaxID=300179 RepID=A0ABN2JCQ1_9MICO